MVCCSEDGAAQTNNLVRRDARLTQRVAYCRGCVLAIFLLIAGCNVGLLSGLGRLADLSKDGLASLMLWVLGRGTQHNTGSFIHHAGTALVLLERPLRRKLVRSPFGCLLGQALVSRTASAWNLLQVGLLQR
ncbi:hypothetical protein ACKKBG_A02900 [Auxenochlorella protothecoides x Auxenochlorella symbiontica]